MTSLMQIRGLNDSFFFKSEVIFAHRKGQVFVYSNKGEHVESTYSNIVTEGLRTALALYSLSNHY